MFGHISFPFEISHIATKRTLSSYYSTITFKVISSSIASQPITTKNWVFPF